MYPHCLLPNAPPLFTVPFLKYTAEVYFDKASDIFYIQTMNSDGAGGYEVIWKVEKGIYKERLVAYGF
jgi:hypothetical protein